VFQPPRQPATNSSPAVVERNTAPVRSATAADGVTSSPTITPAQQRWADQQVAITRADPWSDPSVVITKDPVSGVITAKPRADGQQNGVPPPGPQPRPGPAAVGADGRLVVGDLALSADDIKGLMERASLENSRRAQMPATAGDYSLDLPQDFEFPPGVSEFKFETENPSTMALLGAVKQFAFARGFDQDTLSGLLGLYAQSRMDEDRRFSEARKGEVAKLGSAAITRIHAMNTFLQSQLGSELAGELRKTIFTANAVRAIEKLMKNYVSQGIGGNPGGGRDGSHGQPERISDEAYSK
jgi:hypothetical protein